MLIAMLGLSVMALRADSAAGVYSGRAGQHAVHVPRIDARPTIDGTLSDSVWQRAALLTGFSEYKPVDGVAADDTTQVLVWYSRDAIYFGIRAFEAHGVPHATLANRDQIDGDDNVQIILSPFLHSHQALVFAVNPYGVQEDGTITEGVGKTIGVTGISAITGPDSTDLSSDFVYESKGRLTPVGYQVEVRIPFRSIKFPATSPQSWGINILRQIQHSGHSDTWYPTRLAAASYLDEAGALVGLNGMDAGLVLDLNPVVTQQAARSYGIERPQFGGNARWGITPNLLLNGTYRPDFAEVESDATQIVNDPRVALQYPEKRPFFLDGLEQFNTPNDLVYTRQIGAPIAATKLTGTVGDVSLAYLGAIDQEVDGHPTFDIARAREDFAQGSEIGAVIADKEAGGSFNRVGGADSRITFDKIYTLNVQAVGSSSRDDAVSTAGPLWMAELIRTGRSLSLDVRLRGIDPEFDDASGFTARGGITANHLEARYTVYPTHSALETFAIDLTEIYTWEYRDFTALHAPEDRQFHPTLIATLHGGWQLLYTLALETFGYDPSIYKYYYVGHIGPHDTTYTHYVGGSAIANTDHNLQIITPTFAKFDVSLFQLLGHDENFFEWSPANIWFTSLSLNYRPTDQLRAQLMYNAQVYWRHDDNSIVGKTLIPRLVVEYQLSRPIFFRLVGQYDATYQNTLRDDGRTNLPVFILSPATGTYSRALAFQSNQLQFQGLFSYQPTPGTVAFVGYGNNLFVKFSYLFRL